MSHLQLGRTQEEALRRREQKFEEIKAELSETGFILQGSITERWMECGTPRCCCHEDRDARHGPYYQWSWKSRGQTRSVYLTKEQATLCRKWINNNRRFERNMKRLRSISRQVAWLYKIPKK
jgi:hypothetical protein